MTGGGETAAAAADQGLKALKQQRGAIKSGLTRFQTFLQSMDESVNIELLDARMAKFLSLLDQFDKIEELEDKGDNLERDNFEKCFYESKVKASAMLRSNPPRRNNAVKQQLKLPPIDLPSFSGELDKWLYFHDTFTALVDSNTEFDDIEKFYYLKASLKGDAIAVIQSLETSADNYKVAWTLLRERYHNERLIIHNHVKSLFEIETITKENHGTLRKFLDTISRHLSALKQMGEPIDEWDTPLIYLLSNKLYTGTRKEWEAMAARASPRLTMMDFTKFLQQRCQVLETVDYTMGMGSGSNSQKPTQNKQYAHMARPMAPKCAVCKETHSVSSCKRFLDMSVDERRQNVANCRKCQRRHHTLLHSENNQSSQQTQSQAGTNQQNPPGTGTVPTSTVSTHCLSKIQSSQVLLSTAIVTLRALNGVMVAARVLLDSGSQSNFVTKETCQVLGLTPKRIYLPVSGINNAASVVREATEINIESNYTSFKRKLNFLVVPDITDYLPEVDIDISALKIPTSVRLSDPHFHKSGRVDMLLGAEVFYELLCVGQLKGNLGLIYLKTTLGWIVSGKTFGDGNGTTRTHCNLAISNAQLNSQLEKFWHIEETKRQIMWSEEEVKCENHFKNNTVRTPEGRFMVRLPFKESIPQLGETKRMALNRLWSLERKFERNPSFKQQYSGFMREYSELGHMEAIREDKGEQSGYYLSHHGVVKESSSTTKLRVVYNASMESSNGVSLNDTLLKGPVIQDELLDIIIRFRFHNYVLCSDIEKMYRQVMVHEEDAEFQKIIWREDNSQQVQIYKLRTLTYGTKSASFLATRCLNQLADEESKSFSEKTITAVKKDMYMDDVLTGCASKEQAVILQQELTALLARGGFPLRKWRTNDLSIFENANSQIHEEDTLFLDRSETAKTLGLLWTSDGDYWGFNINIGLKVPGTKKTILSAIARIFDPLGLLGPVITLAKIFMQSLWELKLDWNESIPQAIDSEWRKFYYELQAINNLKIPRKVTAFMENVTIELVGFSDASMKAFGAAIYVRTTDSNGNVASALLASKSRVAPIRTINVPRLELFGALLLAQLMARCKQSITSEVLREYYFTDSTVVLNWLSGSANQWKTFVGNRVAEIQEMTSNGVWLHVSSEDNPADAISRGIFPTAILNNKLWFEGPDWLTHDPSSWQQQAPTYSDNSEAELERKEVRTVLLSHEAWDIFSRYSSLMTLQRVTAYIMRYKHNLLAKRKGVERLDGPLNARELEMALILLIKLAQQQCFSQEIRDLREQSLLSKKSALLSLNPFLDDNGLIRVGGRIQKAAIPYEQRHPVILPKAHPITDLIVTHKHQRLLHAGPQALLASLRRRYWPLNGRNAVRKITRNCITCFKVKPTPATCIMGELPKERVQFTRPFMDVGIDYCGPFNVREKRRRGKPHLDKTYAAIFVCFATKAVHIEAVSDLTTEGFLAALKRFMARRGKCAKIFSDNGTNFRGACNYLKELFQFLRDHESEIQRSLASDGVEWHFIPARSPSFGGLWESAVKGTKHHLRRVAGNALLTLDEFITLLTLIEACLNSRPLIPLSNNSDDLDILTPAHFLIGDSLTGLPERNLEEVPFNRLSRWEHIYKIRQHFWRQWHKLYLAELQQRHKWKSPNSGQPQITVGDLVLLKEDNVPPLKWPLARVTQLHPGSDGEVRVVSVQGAHGSTKRSVRNVCPLPADSQ